MREVRGGRNEYSVHDGKGASVKFQMCTSKLHVILGKQWDSYSSIFIMGPI